MKRLAIIQESAHCRLRLTLVASPPLVGFDYVSEGGGTTPPLCVCLRDQTPREQDRSASENQQTAEHSVQRKIGCGLG